MAFCEKCGNAMNDGAAFCSSCGARVGSPQPSGQRRTAYEGEIRKCPNCGEVLESFTATCPACGYEVRGSGSAESVRIFANQLNAAISDSEKISMITNFPIPNTKEDILEFMILAHTNFDADTYVNTKKGDNISKAWMTKMEQCFLKAKMLFSERDKSFLSLKDMYDQTLLSVDESNQKSVVNKFKSSPFHFLAIIASIFAGFMTLGSFISGAVVSGFFGMGMFSGIIVSILMGKKVILEKYTHLKLWVFIAALLLFIPLGIFLPSAA